LFDVYLTTLILEPANEGVVQYGHAWMRASVKEKKAQEMTNSNPREELNRYLSGPLEEHVDDVVGWWGVSAILSLIPCTDC
jgi:hypothetical protein